ncbi:MAG: RNA pseudouridine synthase [Myxococcaceae bacterium]
MIFSILSEGKGWVAIDKPPGLPVIPGRDEESGPNVRGLLESQYGQRLFVVHRLDRDTSGVLLFALDEETHRELSLGFATGDVKKRYDALVKGRVETAKTVSTRLKKTRGGKMKTAAEGEDGKPSKTRVRPLEVFREATLLECEPLTGRTHQIRVHLADSGNPLLYDHQYGRKEPITENELGGDEPKVVLARTPLHAKSAEFTVAKKKFKVVAPMPADMARALVLLRSVGRHGAQ